MRGIQANHEHVRISRQSLGMTQEQLAALAGIDVKTVRKAERGRCLDLTTLTRIAVVLKVDVGYLIVFTRSPRELAIRRRDAILKFCRCWRERDLEGCVSIYHDEAVLRLPGAPDIPFGGEHRGKAAIRLAHQTVWSTHEVELVGNGQLDLMVSDNTIVVMGMKSAPLADGKLAQFSFLQLSKFIDEGDLVVEQHVEFDTLRFVQLLGLRQR